GVNAFVQATDRLPIEYQLLATTPEPWQPWDACAVFKVRHVFTGGVWQAKLWRARLLRQIGPELTAKRYADAASGQPLIIPPGVSPPLWQTIRTSTSNASNLAIHSSTRSRDNGVRYSTSAR